MTSARRIKAVNTARLSRLPLREIAVSASMDAMQKKYVDYLGERRHQFYILKGKRPVPVPYHRMARWMIEQGRGKHRSTKTIALTNTGSHTVSTIFLGLDHGYQGAPVLFETMAWDRNGKFRDEQYRYRTWEEAMEGHRQYARRLTMQLVQPKPKKS